MRKLKYISICAIIAIMASCKGGGSATPTSTKIQGPLGAYFEIVDKEYSVTDEKISVEIKRIQDGFPEPWTDEMEVGYSDGKFKPTFSIECLDANGNFVSKDETDIVFDNETLKTIAALAVDETAYITFDADDKTASFKMSSNFEVTPEREETYTSTTTYYDTSTTDDETSIDSDDNDGEETSKGSADWDSVLDSYEKFVDKYISLLKKAKNGDMAALAEYPGLMQEAQKCGDRLAAAKGDLSASQLKRYTNIFTKLSNAAASF